MIKKWIALLLFTVAALLSGICAAANSAGEIRVGLETNGKERTSIAISNSSLRVGYEIGGLFYDGGIITAKAGFSAAPSNLYYARLPAAYANFEQADGAAKGYINSGIPAVACLTDSNIWAVYLGGYATESEAMDAAYKNGGSVAARTGRLVALLDGGVAAAIFDSSTLFPQFADASNGQMSIASRKYRGRVEFGRYAGANVTAVNVLSMEEYLYGVVPAEMPKSFHAEALKAQAAAARTYAATKLGSHTGYGLCDTTHCQVYMGVTYESEQTNNAVDATRGIMIYHDGKPINASFFASSGGFTENSENVWTAAVPYLRAVKELNETTAKQWVRSFTLAELTKLLTDNGALIGNATGVSVSSSSGAGRVQELTITGTAGVKVLKKEEIRTFFSKSTDGLLMSRMFTIANGSVTTAQSTVYASNGAAQSQLALAQATARGASGTASAVQSAGASVSVMGADGKVTAYPLQTQTTASGNADSVTFIGSGNGHGVGLSQHGANGMAELGYTFDAILKYYYTGVEVR